MCDSQRRRIGIFIIGNNRYALQTGDIGNRRNDIDQMAVCRNLRADDGNGICPDTALKQPRQRQRQSANAQSRTNLWHSANLRAVKMHTQIGGRRQQLALRIADDDSCRIVVCHRRTCDKQCAKAAPETAPEDAGRIERAQTPQR